MQKPPQEVIDAIHQLAEMGGISVEQLASLAVKSRIIDAVVEGFTVKADKLSEAEAEKAVNNPVGYPKLWVTRQEIIDHLTAYFGFQISLALVTERVRDFLPEVVKEEMVAEKSDKFYPTEEGFKLAYQVYVTEQLWSPGASNN